MTTAIVNSSSLEDGARLDWPAKANILGVMVSGGEYDDVIEPAIEAAARRESEVITAHPVHAIVESCMHRALRAKVNSFAYVAADGQPVRWAMSLLHGIKMPKRIYGPELMLRLCERAARDGISVFFYGSTDEVLEKLKSNLQHRVPGLVVAGTYSPPHRNINAPESDDIIQQINASGAGLVFLGLGCPKQDHFAFNHCEQIQAVQVCVGAGFDFFAGTKRMAPSWMQRNGLEWLFRLLQEPGRLWKRYLVTNTLFVLGFIFAWLYYVPPRWIRMAAGQRAKPAGLTRTPRKRRLLTEVQEATVVIPLFNDFETVAPLAEKLAKLNHSRYRYNIVFVDDGSTDKTSSALREHFGESGFPILTHSHNQGVAAAIMTGIQAAETDIVCSMDCDCTYSPESLSALLDRLDENVAVVTGSPYHPLGKVEQVPIWRVAISRLASQMYRLIFRNKLHTYTSCFRAYRKEQVANLSLRHGGFVGVVELLWHVDRAGGRIVGCPATLSVRQYGQSKMRVLRVSLEHLRFFTRALLESFNGEGDVVRQRHVEPIDESTTTIQTNKKAKEKESHEYC